MQTYYVATLSHYVLVEARTEADARVSSLAALRHSYRTNGHGPEVPIDVRLVRLATPEEVELQCWHDEHLSELAELTEPAEGPFVCPYCDLGWEPSGA